MKQGRYYGEKEQDLVGEVLEEWWWNGEVKDLLNRKKISSTDNPTYIVYYYKLYNKPTKITYLLILLEAKAFWYQDAKRNRT